MTDFRHVESWVFDLDNTLYPADCNLFRQIDARMTEFIRNRLGLAHDDARKLQKDYYVRYGTTMSGLMREHGVAPDDFLDFVHDIDLSPVDRNEALVDRLKALPGKRYIFTNGSVEHAERVMGRLGVGELFSEIFDIRAAEFLPKPHRETYERFLGAHAIAPKASAMFEDIADNLEAAHALGMTTVLVSSNAQWISDEPSHKRPARPDDRHAHVHHVTEDLTGFLGLIETAA
ncbi:MAG TPA: pyrimidine 5'-nucleotidase [Parvularculaceae bacterium]|nr:pyrimidine 5'-nucleotidase [Amphiplicatus sp.]MCB9954271.1 pyrimidine 5'-nucleotidase [Caulobacterales bacterium]HOP18966.1 pyrimidine 5'-nucleotidase [Amphiplicatus sp.]HPE30438.1 pyrimidine 5'-nucleotidase [Parvularculaceae bacterium]HRX39330.1 pyrimidine 5'-nucleotidase [Parvularculaceae bacterium]